MRDMYDAPAMGNTSTDVEKTEGDHDQANNQLETPPRTWRRRKRGRNRHNRAGNTSTDVEKTSFLACPSPCGQKHLHGRGEDLVPRLPVSLWSETPPRTWRRRQAHERADACKGNTSTDVEKTTTANRAPEALQKHLHGRGEDNRRFCPYLLDQETPPRTWRRLRDLRPLFEASQKHLHGRGEDLLWSTSRKPAPETPPRTWRRR